MYIIYDKKLKVDLRWNSDINKLKPLLNNDRIILQTPDNFTFDPTIKRCKIIYDSENDKYYLQCKNKETQEIIDNNIELKLIQ